MKRIDIHYGGEQYSIGKRNLEDLQTEITCTMDPHWLKVNDGDGAPRTAYLLITPGVPIAIIPIPDEEPEGAEDAGIEADEAHAA